MRAFLKNIGVKMGLVYDPFPAAKDINPAEVYFKPFDELRTLLVQWIEDARPQYATRHDFNPEMLGFEASNEGGYGSVYTSPCKRFAIRVSKPGFDLGFKAYMKAALQMQDNPYVPQIYAVLEHDFGQVVLMERLIPLDLDDPDYDHYESMVGNLRAACRYGGLVEPKTAFDTLIRAVQEAMRKNMRNPDAYPDNAMLRISGTTKQLVITDPLS